MKRSVLLGACAVLLAAGVAGAQEIEVGLLLQDQGACTIVRNQRRIDCRKGETILRGDVIKCDAKPSQLKVQWLSREVRLVPAGEKQYKVAFEMPKEKTGLMNLALDVLGFARGGAKVTSVAATRGEPTAAPANFATLLPGQPVTFSWPGAKPQQFSVITDDGKVVFERPLAGELFLVATPEQLGLKPGQNYRWSVTGDQNGRSMTLLDADVADAFAFQFSLIDATQLTAGEKALTKVGMVKLMTDLSPAPLRLGWLCRELIDSNQASLSAADQNTAYFLLDQCQVP